MPSQALSGKLYMRLALGGRLWPMLILPIAALSPKCGLAASGAPAPTANPAPALEILKYDLAANQDTPELCFLLSASIARRPATPLESFVSVEPAATLSATPRKDSLCLRGFVFGNAYTVSLKAGLPGVSGALPKDTQFRIEIPNRPPELGFAAQQGDVLPRIGSEGLPIRSVNVSKIDIQIFRIADDNLPFHRTRAPLTVAKAAKIASAGGERVWQGSVDPKSEANRDAVTMVPIEQTVGPLKPGLYVAIAKAASMPVDGQVLPTQYFAVSDLGLSAYRGPASLLVGARSLASAASAPGIDIALVGANNRELGRVRTDGNGFARFDPNLLRGSGGDRPASILAYGPAGEFAALDLGSEAIETETQPVAALIHADRAVYRPGETVNILTLVRNDQGGAVSKTPLTANIIRPNGAIFNSQVLSDQGAGSYNFATTLPEDGAEGTWRIEIATETGDRPIGIAKFDVESPTSSRLSLSLNADVAVIDPAQPANVAIQSSYPDGQAPNLPGELHVAVAAAPVPFPAFPEFAFGLADESIPPLSLDPIRFTADATGKSLLSVKFSSPLKSTRPLEALITARMFDAGGRAVERSVSVPVVTQSLLLGVKPAAASTAGQNAHFEIIAVSPDGARQEKPGTGWEILRQASIPSWYWNGERFDYRSAVKDTHIAGGTVDVPADAPAMLDTGLPAGRYRIEVFDPNGEAISSARFTVGWAARNAGDPADKITIKPAKPFYSPGDTADIFVQPPFDADVVLASADPQMRDAAVQHVPAAGATMRLTMPRDAGLEMRLLATAIAPPEQSVPGLTRRAFGQASLSSDPMPHALDVKLDLPETVIPQQSLAIPVTVSGAADEPVYVRIAAIDKRQDGSSPESDSLLDPLIGRQMSAVSALDNYGRIITSSGLSSGVISVSEPSRTPHRADQDGRKSGQEPLALYSAVVTLDKSGKGTVPLQLPDFAGTLKVEALAWSSSRSGQAEAEVAVRYPLNTTLAVPAFLTPDDRADLTLALDNADGPRGEYRVSVRGEGAVTVQDTAEAVFNLAEHEQRTAPVSVTGHAPGGAGTIVITVKGPNGMGFERSLPLPVRSAIAGVTRHATLMAKPGAGLTIDPALTAGLRPDTITTWLTASAGNDLDLGGIVQDIKSAEQDSAAQIVNAAMPTLMPPGGAVEQFAKSLAAYQCGDGGFSLFPSGQSDRWLTAYVTDFLSQAKSGGAAVSDIVLRQALDYLALRMDPAPGTPSDPTDGQSHYSQQALAEAAYAYEVLAGNGRLDLFQLRYFKDRFQSQISNPVTMGLIAASFAKLGDKTAAATAFARAGSLPIDLALNTLFGSDLRDQAMLTALMIESGAVAQPMIAAAAAKTTTMAAAHRQFSGQEASWLYRAGIQLSKVEGKVKLKIGDKTVEQSLPFTMGAIATPMPAIKNTGDAPLNVAMTVTGLPAPEARDQAGYEVQRWFFDTSGKPIDPATMRQGDIAVVVLTGRFTGQGETNPLLSDSLPAGWEVEAAEISDPIVRYPWLKDLTGSSYTTISKGRYVAVPRLAGDRHEFKLAYVVRAAIRGQFSLPGTVIEDMAQPTLSARSASGRTKVDPPS